METAPRNNLNDVLRRHISSGSPSCTSIPNKDLSLKSSRFKPSHLKARNDNPRPRSTDPQDFLPALSRSLPSFSTPGFRGRDNSSANPLPLERNKERKTTSDSPITNSRSFLKRSSSDLSSPSPRKGSKKAKNKRPKIASADEDKENVSVNLLNFESQELKCADKVVYDADILHAGEQQNEGSGSEKSGTAFDFNMAEVGLHDKTLDELKALLCIDLELRVNAMQAVIDYHCSKKDEMRQDLFILQGYNALLDIRVSAIRDTIERLEQKGSHGDNASEMGTSRVPLENAANNRASKNNNSTAGAHTTCVSRGRDELWSASQSEDELWASFDNNPAAPAAAEPSIVEIEVPSDVEVQHHLQDIASTRSKEAMTLYRSEALRVLKEAFNLDEFRPNQFEAISATMDGKDVFVLMPTGGGKSLCYQVPAVCHGGKTDGVTVVVSPLIALMIDQVHHLKNKGIDAVLFNSDQGTDNSRDTRNRLIASGRKPRLLYVTPEKLHHSGDMRNILGKLYQSRMLARFVVDEAHCVSTWGRDFRDAYQDLGRLRTDYPGVPIMALTATANEQVISDVVDRLRMDGCVRLTQSFNRPNLFYEIRAKKRNVVADISAFIKDGHLNETGVIYCLSRKSCEEVARELRESHGLRAKHYHAQMSADDKSRAQSSWQNGECEIIVATIAFGMGIDKANVRYVIHHSLPMSLDGYYQETGRAGRDGKPATCVLYYAFGDTNVLFRLIKESEKSSLEEKKRQEDGVRLVVQYCANDVDCRRTQLLGYFGQAFNGSDCGKLCDNCQQKKGMVEEDMTEVAKNVVRLAQSLLSGGNERITKTHCMNVFRGCSLKDIKDRHHDKLPLFGAGRGLQRHKIERLYDHLELFEVLKQQAFQNQTGWNTMYLQIGPSVDNLLRGSMNVVMKFRAEDGKMSRPSVRVIDSNVNASKKRRIMVSRQSPILHRDPGGEACGDIIDLYEDDTDETDEQGIQLPLDVDRSPWACSVLHLQAFRADAG